MSRQVANAGHEAVDELKDDMEKIKVLCIATHVMEITRNLPLDSKKNLETYCDKVMLDYDETITDRDQAHQLVKKHMEFKSKHIDLQSIKRVSNLEFREEDENFLKSLFKKTKNKGFKDYYSEMVTNAERLTKSSVNSQNIDAIMEKNEKKKGQGAADEASMNMSGAQAAQGKSREDGSRIKPNTLKNINVLEKELDKEETQKFFEKLLEAFHQINFYNLLQPDVENLGRV